MVGSSYQDTQVRSAEGVKKFHLDVSLTTFTFELVTLLADLVEEANILINSLLLRFIAAANDPCDRRLP